ncbi:predicted protein [Nematostella vectensis]|uniref:Fungal lipase-type domain-containing protein n=1 Tax=Nematostella vectensis TaxID=45351 RepID=A7RW46_NEMVE|nr:predicted protein [Nematostella vectensis]|eukprot:XP_001636451.1 predicted protein [Nematostella vectensis]
MYDKLGEFAYNFFSLDLSGSKRDVVFVKKIQTVDMTDAGRPSQFQHEVAGLEDGEEETKKTCRWRVFAVIHGISRLAVLLTICTFFLTSFISSLNVALKVTYELPARHAKHTALENLASVCLLVLLGCTIILASVVLSLFWEVVLLVFYKTSKPWMLTVIVLFAVTLIVVTVFNTITASERPIVIRFLENSFETSWWVILVFTTVVSAGLMFFVYKEKRYEKLALAWKMGLLISEGLLAVFLILTPVSFQLTGSSPSTVAFSFFYILFAMIAIVGLVLRGKKIKRKKQISLINWKIMFALGFFYFLILMIAGVSGVTSDVKDAKSVAESWPDGARTQGREIFPRNVTNPNQLPKYLICQNRWSSLNFNIMELGYLARLPYRIVTNQTEISYLANVYFKERGLRWELKRMTSSKPVFYHMHERGSNVHVIGIRGTKTTGDWFENAQLWGEIFIMQAVSSILPIQRLPKRVISSFIYRSGMIGDLLTSDRAKLYFQSIEDYIRDIRSKNSSMEILLVGHSLGGGVAKFIGAKMKIPAVAFSSPGEVYNHVKFGYTYNDLQRYTATVIPDGDFVTWIDKHGGFIQNIRCAVKGIMGCHKVLSTYCELRDSCGWQSRMKCPNDN